MRKLLAVLASITVLFSASALADSLTSLTDSELLELYRSVCGEMERRQLTEDPAEGTEESAVTDRVLSFFYLWGNNRLDEMLNLCSPGWKKTVEDPRTKLFGILQNRTPMDITIETASKIGGESPNGLTWYLVTGVSHLDRNDGAPAAQYRIRLLAGKESDGLWYIDPSGLLDCEKVEEEIITEVPASPDELRNSFFLNIRNESGRDIPYLRFDVYLPEGAVEPYVFGTGFDHYICLVFPGTFDDGEFFQFDYCVTSYYPYDPVYPERIDVSLGTSDNVQASDHINNTPDEQHMLTLDFSPEAGKTYKLKLLFDAVGGWRLVPVENR